MPGTKEPLSWLIRRGVRAEWGTSRNPDGMQSLLSSVRTPRWAAHEAVGCAVPTLMMWTPVIVAIGLVLGYLLRPAFGVAGQVVGLAVTVWPAIALGVKYVRALARPPASGTLDSLLRDWLDLALAAPLATALALTAF